MFYVSSFPLSSFLFIFTKFTKRRRSGTSVAGALREKMLYATEGFEMDDGDEVTTIATILSY